MTYWLFLKKILAYSEASQSGEASDEQGRTVIVVAPKPTDCGAKSLGYHIPIFWNNDLFHKVFKK